MYRFILHNDDIRDASDKTLCAGQIGLLSGWGVFSTIRVCHGVLFAFERHWARMHKDAALLRVPFPEDPEYIRTRLMELVRANGVEDATLRVVVVRNRGGIWEGPGNDRDFDLIALLTKLKNWGSGVTLGMEPQARHAASPFAGAKILSWALNLTVLEQAQCRGFDEVILLNERGEVSECTSANLFVSFGTEVWTPPLSSGCLPGVTRELLVHEVKAEGISVGEKTLLPSDLEAADAVFITSTTRDLLPVRSIEGLNVRHDGRVRELLESAFGSYMERYVREHKTLAKDPVKA